LLRTKRRAPGHPDPSRKPRCMRNAPTRDRSLLITARKVSSNAARQERSLPRQRPNANRARSATRDAMLQEEGTASRPGRPTLSDPPTAQGSRASEVALPPGKKEKGRLCRSFSRISVRYLPKGLCSAEDRRQSKQPDNTSARHDATHHGTHNAVTYGIGSGKPKTLERRPRT